MKTNQDHLSVPDSSVTPPMPSSAPAHVSGVDLSGDGCRKCEFCGCNTNAKVRGCCKKGRSVDFVEAFNELTADVPLSAQRGGDRRATEQQQGIDSQGEKVVTGRLNLRPLGADKSESSCTNGEHAPTEGPAA